MDNPDDLLTTDDVSRIMGVTRATVRYQIKTGVLRAQVIGQRTLVFRRRDVDEAMKYRETNRPPIGRPFKVNRGKTPKS